MYLAYTPIEMIPHEVQLRLAVDLCISAITSKTIFNFGEVIGSPVLAVLKTGEKHIWLYNLIHALNSGDLSKFNEIMTSVTHPDLVANKESIKEKIILLSVMNLVFQKPSHDREISFTELEQATGLPNTQIEMTLMKALSLKLIKGTINEAEQTCTVTWVLPRVLNKDDIRIIDTQLDVWSNKVKSTLVMVEDQAAEL